MIVVFHFSTNTITTTAVYLYVILSIIEGAYYDEIHLLGKHTKTGNRIRQ